MEPAAACAGNPSHGSQRLDLLFRKGTMKKRLLVLLSVNIYQRSNSIFRKLWGKLPKLETQSLTVKLLHLEIQKLDSCRGDVHKAPSNLKALMEFKRLKTKIFFWNLNSLLKTTQSSVV